MKKTKKSTISVNSTTVKKVAFLANHDKRHKGVYIDLMIDQKYSALIKKLKGKN